MRMWATTGPCWLAILSIAAKFGSGAGWARCSAMIAKSFLARAIALASGSAGSPTSIFRSDMKIEPLFGLWIIIFTFFVSAGRQISRSTFVQPSFTRDPETSHSEVHGNAVAAFGFWPTKTTPYVCLGDVLRKAALKRRRVAVGGLSKVTPSTDPLIP